MHVKRHMVFESLYAIHVHSHFDWNHEYEMDQAHHSLDDPWLVRRRNRLLYRMSPFQGILGCAASGSTMHNSGALCHCSGGVQLEQRFIYYCCPGAHDSIAETTNEAETGTGGPLQHGYLRRTFLRLSQFMSLAYMHLQIIAAILTKVYNLSDVYSTTYMLWYTREASVAVYVANLPGIWPLLREHIRFLREHTNNYPSGQSRIPGYTSQQYGNISHHKSNHLRTFATLDSAEVELAYKIREKVTEVQDTDIYLAQTQRGTSQNSDGQEVDPEAGSSWKGRGVMGVQVDTRVEIQSGRWSRGGSEHGQSQLVWCEGPEAQAGRE